MSGISVQEAVKIALPKLRIAARSIRSRMMIDPLEVDDLVQVGALVYLQRYNNGLTYPHAFAMKSAEWAMLDAVYERNFNSRGNRNARLFPVMHVVEITEFAARTNEQSTMIPRKVKRAIRSLKRPYRDVLWAVYVDHMGHSEYAAAVGAKQSTVATHHRRAVELLRFKLTGVKPTRTKYYKPVVDGPGRGGPRLMTRADDRRRKSVGASS